MSYDILNVFHKTLIISNLTVNDKRKLNGLLLNTD
jgi:hypothetical protein